MWQSRQSGAPPREAQGALASTGVTPIAVVEVVRTYLELRSPEQLRPARFDEPAVRVLRRDAIDNAHYRRLYERVGAPWHWTDRNKWSEEKLATHLARGVISVWECVIGEDAVGFFELELHPDGAVEIAYFGLTPNYIGRGFGKALLSRAVEEAWALGAERVWLHTCTLDSPHALPNYEARGFTAFRRETYVAQLPEPAL